MNFKEVAWLVVLRMHLAFVACEHFLGRQHRLIEFIGGEDETTVLVDKCLTGRQP